MLALLAGVSRAKSILSLFGCARETNGLVKVLVLFFESGHDGRFAYWSKINLTLRFLPPGVQEVASFFAANLLALRHSGGLGAAGGVIVRVGAKSWGKESHAMN